MSPDTQKQRSAVSQRTWNRIGMGRHLAWSGPGPSPHRRSRRRGRPLPSRLRPPGVPRGPGVFHDPQDRGTGGGSRPDVRSAAGGMGRPERPGVCGPLRGNARHPGRHTPVALGRRPDLRAGRSHDGGGHARPDASGLLRTPFRTSTAAGRPRPGRRPPGGRSSRPQAHPSAVRPS